MKACAFLFIALGLLVSPHALAQLPGQGAVEVTAEDRLEWREEEGRFLAVGKAQATRDDLTVQADELSAYQTQGTSNAQEIEKLVARGHVVVTKGNVRIAGGMGHYHVKNNLAIITGGPLTLTQDNLTLKATQRLEYDGPNKKAYAFGDVVAVDGDKRVTADQLVANLRPNAKGQDEIYQIIAHNNVTVTTQEDIARGQKLVFDMGRNIAILSGNVQITRAGSQFSGEVAEVDFAKGQSRLLPSGRGSRVRALLFPTEGNP